MRVAILGNSGSGKSTLASLLARETSAPTLDLDTVAWEPGQIAVPRDPDVAARELATFCDGHPDWIIEGCYATLIGQSLRWRPTLLFLDPGVERCLAHCLARPWEPHKYASKEEQDQRLEPLLQWVREYPERAGELGRAAHLACFDGYDGPKQRLEEVDTRRVQLLVADFRLQTPHQGR